MDDNLKMLAKAVSSAEKPPCKYRLLRAIAHDVATKSPKRYPPDLLQRLVDEANRMMAETDNGPDHI